MNAACFHSLIITQRNVFEACLAQRLRQCINKKEKTPKEKFHMWFFF